MVVDPLTFGLCPPYLLAMKSTVDEVRSQALVLSPGERAALAHDLIVSLDSPDTLGLGTKAEAEISRRVHMVREGTAKGRPAEQVFREIEAKHASRDK